MAQATTFVLLAEIHMRGVSTSPEQPGPLPDPGAFIDDERTEAGSEEVATTMSQTEAEVDELPEDVDMVRRVSLLFNGWSRPRSIIPKEGEKEVMVVLGGRRRWRQTIQKLALAYNSTPDL